MRYLILSLSLLSRQSRASTWWYRDMAERVRGKRGEGIEYRSDNRRDSAGRLQKDYFEKLLFLLVSLLGCLERSSGKRFYRTMRRDCMPRLLHHCETRVARDLWAVKFAKRTGWRLFSLTSSSYDMSNTLRIHVTLALTSSMFFLYIYTPCIDAFAFRFASTHDAFWLGCTGSNASLKIRVWQRVDKRGECFSVAVSHPPFATNVQVALQRDLCSIRLGEHILGECKVNFSLRCILARISQV